MKIWKEISGERLVANFNALQRILSDGQEPPEEPIALLAVVKADAYGHGLAACAGPLVLAGATWLGVTDAQEGAKLRTNEMGTATGREVQILVMSGTMSLTGEAESVVRNRLTAVVWEPRHIQRLAEAAHADGSKEPVRVHLEIDSGMSRQGVAPGAALDAVLEVLRDEPLVTLDGVMTHFASTEVAGSAQTTTQQRCFEGAMAQAAASGLRPQWVHVGNSSYLDNADAAAGESGGGDGSLEWLRRTAKKAGARAMVRSGLALYGYVLPTTRPGTSLAGPQVQTVMTWKTRVAGVREIQAGALVGYNGTFAAKRPMRLALLPAGYADGLRRELSSTNAKAGGWVMIRGGRAPIVGRVSMNLTSVDVSEIAEVTEGDEVVLLGEGLSADEHARLSGTIAYEVLCGTRTRE